MYVREGECACAYVCLRVCACVCVCVCVCVYLQDNEVGAHQVQDRSPQVCPVNQTRGRPRQRDRQTLHHSW